MSALTKILERSRSEKESWRYTDIEKILKNSPSFPRRRESILPDGKMDPRLRGGDDAKNQVRFVFTDGVLQKDKSRFGDLPENIMSGDREKGYCLRLEGKTCLVTSPVELLFTSEKAQESAVKLRIELGESGRLTLIERHESESLHVMESEISLAKQAKLVHGKIVLGRAGAHIANTKVRVEEGAFYDNFALLKGGALVRNEIDVTLNGKMAQCALNGAMLAKDHDHLDTATRITHAAPFGTSREFYKSVLADSSRAVFQGKILVAKDAQKTDGHQLSRALLLSEQAEMDAKPELEIYADDVKCSHGSTVGDLDEAAMFYLRARGIGEHEARALLIEAFIGEILNEIRAPEILDACRAEVEGYLS